MSIPFTALVHDTRWSEVPPEIQNYARMWLLDLIGVGAAGSQTHLSLIIRDHAVDQFAAGTLARRCCLMVVSSALLAVP